MTELTIATWNVRWSQRANPRIEALGADIFVITEGRPANIPAKEHILTSRRSMPDHPNENTGGRKVVMWSRYGWVDVDRVGAESLPPGRFIAATVPLDDPLHIIGVCIPYRDYRNRESKKYQRQSSWQGNRAYLTALRDEILTRERFQRRTIIIGDFNLHIPPRRYPGPRHAINALREATFAGRTIVTETVTVDDKPLVDHIVLTPDLTATHIEAISRFDDDGTELSDHPTLVMRVRV